MLVIEIPACEMYDEINNLFVQTKPTTLRLEHSLLSVFKWEAIWRKPFLDPSAKKTYEELVSYVECMCLNQNEDKTVFKTLSAQNWDEIEQYINTEQTATWFRGGSGPGPSREILTAELIYYYMTAYNIPTECQKWHLSRLLVLLRICGIKNSPEKKMSMRSVMSQNASLNALRRKAMHTKG